MIGINNRPVPRLRRRKKVTDCHGHQPAAPARYSADTEEVSFADERAVRAAFAGLALAVVLKQVGEVK